jgi:3-deoxy-7-phosphoheptulonate synthase
MGIAIPTAITIAAIGYARKRLTSEVHHSIQTAAVRMGCRGFFLLYCASYPNKNFIKLTGRNDTNMVVVMKPNFTPEQLETAIKAMEAGGVRVMVSKGTETTILGAEGNAAGVDQDRIGVLPGVDRVMRVTEPFKKSNRKYHPDDSVIDLGSGATVGGNRIAVIAGPCSVETPEQITGIAETVKTSGAAALRGGAFKPRTSPYSFQGMGLDGIRLLQEAKALTGLPIVTEIMSTEHVGEFEENVDVIQVGARNMQNFDLLKRLGKTTKPILLKRGLSSTIEEWLMSAEYIMAGGNHQVILCERGIRTFETFTRNTLDLSAVLAVKQLSHLPVVVDPSHACGKAWMVERMAMAAIAAGADGLIIEVHNDPKNALCDGAQSITPTQFSELMPKLTSIAHCVGRSL